MNARFIAALFAVALMPGAWADQVRVMVQVIEVPHAVLTKWTTKGKVKGEELYERAVKLVATGEAEIIDTNVVVARNGEKGVVESISERISPTEYEVSGLMPVVPPGKEQDEKLKVRRVWRAYDAAFQNAFEVRNTGASMEIEPTVGQGGKLVDLRFAFELVDRVALETWTEFRDEWGDASVRMPVYTARRITGAITQRPGSFELFNVFTPKAADVPAAATRQLVFVRCDVLPVAN